MNEPQLPPDAGSRAMNREPASKIESARRWCRRHPIIALLMVTLASCVMVTTAVIGYFAVEDRNSAKSKAAPSSGGDRAAEVLSGPTAADEIREAASEPGLVEASARTKLALEQSLQFHENTRLSAQRRYISDMKLVQIAWEDGQVGVVLDLLDRHRPAAEHEDFRGFEWYYWNRLCHYDRVRISGDEDKTRDVAADPAESKFVSESFQEIVKLRNAGTQKPTRTLKGHASGVHFVSFSSDGTRIASASRDGIVKIWDAITAEENFTFKGDMPGVCSVACSPGSVVFSADGTRIAIVSSAHRVNVLDAGSGQELFTLEGHTDSVNCIAFSPDGTRIASASNDQTVKLWDAIMGEESVTLKGHASAVLCVGFSPDQSRIVSGSVDGTIMIWDAPLEKRP